MKKLQVDFVSTEKRSSGKLYVIGLKNTEECMFMFDIKS